MIAWCRDLRCSLFLETAAATLAIFSPHSFWTEALSARTGKEKIRRELPGGRRLSQETEPTNPVCANEGKGYLALP